MSVAERFSRLPTAAKLLLILTAALLPIGIALAWMSDSGIRQADSALEDRNQDRSHAAANSIDSLIARNALALRIAANGALAVGPEGACDRSQRALGIAPAISQSFELETPDGKPICAVGNTGNTGELEVVAPGDIRSRIAPSGDAVAIRVGVINGMATALIGMSDLRTAAAATNGRVDLLVLRDGARELALAQPAQGSDPRLRISEWPLSNGNLRARIGVVHERIATLDRLILLLPLLMWIAAALVAWLLVNGLLIQPLKRLERGVRAYQPGDGNLELPGKLGPSEEIRGLRNAFARTIAQIEESERDTATALEGQRRLVREVHHRVKNNLQVVASLLNIHGRSASTPEARAAYAGISRRVGALSIVHRNHFAEMEENRGIALRPLVTELGAELRASAPDTARGLSIDLDIDTLHTTQDIAVAIAFLITEIVEFAMLRAPSDGVEISLRRTSELTGRLSLSSPVLVPEDEDEPDKVQFERIVGGLAKQLRSSLERKLGRYSVDFPVFPAN